MFLVDMEILKKRASTFMKELSSETTWIIDKIEPEVADNDLPR